MREGGVERMGWDGEPVRLGDLKAHVVHPSLDGQRTRLLDLCGLEIDADYLAGSHHIGHTQRDGPWAAAYIQHLHAAM